MSVSGVFSKYFVVEPVGQDPEPSIVAVCAAGAWYPDGIVVSVTV